MNINLFKKKTVLPIDYLNQIFVTQNEFKELKMTVRQLNKKLDEPNVKKNTKDMTFPKIFKEIKYSFRSNKKEINIESNNPIIDINVEEGSDDDIDIIIDHSNTMLTNLNDNFITHKQLEEKSNIIIQDIHNHIQDINQDILKHIQDINQYNYTINGYLLKELRDRIDEQDQLIDKLYNIINIKNDNTKIDILS
jgi:L-cysteine desulfidase